jgi:hypothetical protein
MNKWKIAFWISTVLLLTTVVVAAYVLIDQSVTIMYMRDGYEGTENDLKSLTELINDTDLSKEQIENRLNDHRLYEFMDFKSDTIGLERIQLIFENGQLERIENQWWKIKSQRLTSAIANAGWVVKDEDITTK